MDKVTEFSREELRAATLDFSTTLHLGHDKRQRWYRACIPGHGLAIVKRFQEVRRSTLNQVVDEVKLHRSLRGRQNPFVAKLVGYCICEKDPMLVFEFVPPGDCTLRECLENGKLKWQTRLKVAMNIASALQTLHGADNDRAPLSVFVRDLEAKDILLDYTQTNLKHLASDPKLINLSGALIVPNKARTTHICPSFSSGPRVYTDPYYIKTGQLTDKTDVYSFGVLLIELLTGLSACDELPPSSHGPIKSLVSLATETAKVGRLYEYQIVDPCLESTAPFRASISEVASLATKCCAFAPRKRPSITAVHQALVNNLATHFPSILPAVTNTLRDKAKYQTAIVVYRNLVNRSSR